MRPPVIELCNLPWQRRGEDISPGLFITFPALLYWNTRERARELRAGVGDRQTVLQKLEWLFLFPSQRLKTFKSTPCCCKRRYRGSNMQPVMNSIVLNTSTNRQTEEALCLIYLLLALFCSSVHSSNSCAEVELLWTFSLKTASIILLQWTNVSSKCKTGKSGGQMRQRASSVIFWQSFRQNTCLWSP